MPNVLGRVAIRSLLTVSCAVLPLAPARAQAWNPFKSKAQPAARAPQTRMPQMTMPQVGLPQVNLPQVPMPQVSMPQFSMPNIPMPQAPQIQNPISNMNFPSFGAAKTSGNSPLTWVGKWNRSTQQFFDKTKQALTLPTFKAPQVNNRGTMFGRLPFSKPKTRPVSVKSIFPAFGQRQEPAQPPTLQDWLGQPRP